MAESSAGSMRKAPELAINASNGKEILLSQYTGKVVAIEFIRTTCPHCQASSKFMSALQSKYGAQGFQVLAAAVNPDSNLLVENFVKDYQVNFPVGWLSPEQVQTFMQFSSSYFVVPQLALVDRSGMIRFQTPAKEDQSWDELMKQENLVKDIELLLTEKNIKAHKSRGN